VILKNGVIEEVSRTLQQLEDRLYCYGFVRVYHNYLVNKRYLKANIRVAEDKLILPDGYEISKDSHVTYKYRLSDILDY